MSRGRIENESQVTGILHALRGLTSEIYRSISSPHTGLDSGGPLCIALHLFVCVLCLSISAVELHVPNRLTTHRAFIVELEQQLKFMALSPFQGPASLYLLHFIACHLYLVKLLLVRFLVGRI